MDKASCKTALFVFWLIIISIQIPSTIEERQSKDNEKEDEPSFKKTMRHTISLLKHSHWRSWEKIKTAMHEIQLRYFPPNLDFRGSGEANPGKMKDVLEKSFRISEKTVEGSAESAAEVVGKTVQKTAKKVRESVTEPEEESNAEL